MKNLAIKIVESLSLCVFALIFYSFANAQGIPIALPQTLGMSAEKLNRIDVLVEKDIADKKLPGAVVIVGHQGKIVYRKAFGNRALVPNVEKMTIDTIFDVASLTKPIATATSIMILVERGELRLNDTIGKFIPEIEDENAKKVTILQLLTHVSGYQPDFDLREKWTGREGMLAALKKEKLKQPAGTKFVYSDIGFIVLGEIIQRLSGNETEGFGIITTTKETDLNEVPNFNSLTFTKSFGIFAYKNIFEQLNAQKTKFYQPGAYWEVRGGGIKMPNTAFQIGSNNYKLIAPTENLKGQQNYLGSKFEGDEKNGEYILRGWVHDPTSFRMGGVAGHAGLFSTADDVARYCQMLLNGGILDGKRIMSPNTVAKMTSPYVISEDGATRGLGWDMNTSFSSNRGELFPLGSFGHTGFTGTGVWVDRVSQTFVVFMSNRVHPDGKGDVAPLRAKIATVAASAIENYPIEAMRLAESIYWSQVTPQIEKFRSQQSAVSSQQSVKNVTVLNGIDVLEKENFKSLENLKIGLVTNHTGRNLSGKQTIDILFEAKNVKLVSLFAPEHGIRGELDQSKIDDGIDEKTKLPIYSLYGDTRRPKPEQLKDLDAIVFDIQDIGVRFYTYEATLLGVMEEAAKAKIPVIVLDRPNPINGLTVEGAVADSDKLSFVVSHTVPLRHGLTIGELGAMMNSDKKIGADLRVVKMENWSRSMWFDETGQTWVNPSPNMRSLTEATLYPGIGLMETTNLSVGRGTDTPFEIIGAPWIDGQKLAKYLNEKNLSGVRFVPIRFTPKASVFKDENCNGINIVITNRGTFKSVQTGIEIALALRKLFPNDWKSDNYNRLLGNVEIFELVRRAEPFETIEKAQRKKIDEFIASRAQFLLYK